MAKIPSGVVLAALLLAPLALGAAGAQEERPRRVANVSLQDEGCPEGPDRFCAQPDSVTLEDETDLILRVTNEGRVEHNLTFGEDAPEQLARHGMNDTLAPNQTQRLRIPWNALSEGLEQTGAANATLHCGLDGHAALGERLRIEVPSLAAGEERPQPGPGAWAALAALGIVAVAARRR